MILEFLKSFEVPYNILLIINYLFGIIGVSLIVYVFCMFCVITFTLFKTKDVQPIKAIHIMSIVEVYAIVCLILGIILISKSNGLMTAKMLLFIFIIIFNGITATRLISKTAYFYNLRFRKSPKQTQEKI